MLKRHFADLAVSDKTACGVRVERPHFKCVTTTSREPFVITCRACLEALGQEK